MRHWKSLLIAFLIFAILTIISFKVTQGMYSGVPGGLTRQLTFASIVQAIFGAGAIFAITWVLLIYAERMDKLADIQTHSHRHNAEVSRLNRLEEYLRNSSQILIALHSTAAKIAYASKSIKAAVSERSKDRAWTVAEVHDLWTTAVKEVPAGFHALFKVLDRIPEDPLLAPLVEENLRKNRYSPYNTGNTGGRAEASSLISYITLIRYTYNAGRGEQKLLDVEEQDPRRSFLAAVLSLKENPSQQHQALRGLSRLTLGDMFGEECLGGVRGIFEALPKSKDVINRLVANDLGSTKKENADRSSDGKTSDRELLETQSPYYYILRRMSEEMEQRFDDVMEIFNAPL